MNRHRRRRLRVMLLCALLFGAVLPSLQADLLRQTWAEAGFTYTREGPQTYFDAAGVLQTLANDTIAIGHDPATLAPRGNPRWAQSTNLCLHSGNLAGTGWAGAGISTSTGATAPDGVSSYTRLTVGASSNAHEWYRTFTAASGTTYTASGIVRYTGSQRWVRLTIYATGLVGSAWFDLENGVWGTVSGGTTAHPVEALGNGQYRIAISAAATASGTGYWDIMASPSDGFNGAWLGAGTTYDVWAAQMEALAFPTAYIPTTSAAVTRYYPVITRTLGPLYGGAQGTLVSKSLVGAISPAVNMGLAYITNGTTDNSYGSRITTTGSVATATSQGLGGNGGFANQVAITSGAIAARGSVFRAALAFAANDTAYAANGALIGTDTGCTIGTMDRIEVAPAAGTSEQFNGWDQGFAFYNTRLRGAALLAVAA